MQTIASPAAFTRLTTIALGLLVAAPIGAARAQEPFKTPEQAIEALVNAARKDDQKAILSILGPDGADIASSGDDVADNETREKFVAAYDAKHQVTMDGDSKAVMVIGQDDFPFPIPLVKKNDAWRFDSAAGREEILYRRIGRNELDAIQASLAYVDAQNEYADKNRVGGVSTYAQKIISSPGKKDGLYWPTSGNEDPSPLGELVAQATQQGYRVGGERAPFHGYYFKILNKQGPAAPGGALNYVVSDKMIGGFGLVAYPASYRNSGVMTFIVSHDGVVYQKDLGPKTAQIAERMTSFNPDGSWTAVDVKTSSP
jgi:DUF2950 family protein